MNRRMRMAVLAAGCTMLLMMLAASSGPIRIWLTPSPGMELPRDGAILPVTTEPHRPVPTDRIEVPKFVGTVLQLLAGLLTILVVVMALTVVRAGYWTPPRWRRWRDGIDGQISSLPEVHERALTVDMDSARAALSGGTPRNAIVACWMQLESDAGAAGLPRLAAETPAEYVERVVVASSVDPEPIGELAALFREARFSRHELGDAHRKRAFAALDRVASTLRHGVEVPA